MQRTELRPLLTLSFVLLLTPPLAAQNVAAPGTVAVDADSVVKYVLSCRKPNGAFGPIDQEYTDLPWNYAAVWSVQTLGAADDVDAAAIVAHGLGGPAGHGGGSHRQFYEYHALRTALKQKFAPQQEQVQVYHQGFKRNYYAGPFGDDGDLLFKTGRQAFGSDVDLQADAFYYYNISSLDYLLSGLYCSGRAPREPQPLIDYILRRRTTGGFGDGAESGGGDAHIAHTLAAVRSLQLLGAAIPDPELVAAFVRSCRDKQGGYRWNPKLSLPGNEPDVYYTMVALETLQSLGLKPDAPETTAAWLNSLQNADGGFGDRPGWKSRLESTTYAVTALASLGSNVRRSITAKQVPVPKLAPIADGEFQIYQAQFKLPILKPDELAGLSKRGLNLLGLKSYDFADAERLLDAIQSQKLPMDVVLCPEMYPHRLTQLGATLNHVGNFTLDARWNAEQRAAWAAADAAGREYPTWAAYRDQVIAPVRKLGGIAYPEQDFEMEYAYIAYDSVATHEDFEKQLEDELQQERQRLDDELTKLRNDKYLKESDRESRVAIFSKDIPYRLSAKERQFSLRRERQQKEQMREGKGYNAVLVGFNWPPKDFVRVFPWHERYTDRLTPIADVDAHGDLKKWSEQLDTVRTLFLAKGPTYADFQKAAAAGRVVSVIAKPEGVASGASYYGPAAAVEYVKQRRAEWQWWK